MQIIFQDPYGSPVPEMTAGASVAEESRIPTASSASARFRPGTRLVEEFGLDPSYVEKYPHEFSGGQRQRIGIARALAVTPRSSSCDEPVSSASKSRSRPKSSTCCSSCKRTAAWLYLFIAHDLAVVRQIAHRVAVMYSAEWSRWATRRGPGTTLHHTRRALLSQSRSRTPPRSAPDRPPGEHPSPTPIPAGALRRPLLHPRKDTAVTRTPGAPPVGESGSPALRRKSPKP